MDRILITGVAGFIGSKVANYLISKGHNVIGVDDLSSGSIDNVPSKCKFIKGDLSNESTISKIPKNCTKILHLAGQSSGEISFDDPIKDLEKNTISTLNLINYGIKNNSERIVYASSMSIYGNVKDEAVTESQILKPLSCYGVGKLAAEGYLRVYQKQLPYVSMRMFNVYGPGQNLNNLRQGMVSIYVAQALTMGRIQVKGGLDRFRDFIHIDDVVSAWVKAAFSNKAIGKSINIGTGIRTPVKDLLEKIVSKTENASFYQDGSTPGDQTGIYCDNSVMKETLDIRRFISLDEGLEHFINWARNKVKE
jgi:UDP-glucose 4-epimerase